MLDYQNGNGDPLHSGPSYEPPAPPALGDDLRRYLGLAWHWAWLIVLFAVIGGVVGFLTSSRTVPLYRATSTIWVSESRTLNEYANILASERLAETYALLMVQKPVFEGVIDELGLNLSATDLKNRVSVSVVEATQLLRITVEDTDPLRAAQIANTVGEVFARINEDFQTARYTDSKETLSAQLAQMDQQIQEANQQLADLQAAIPVVEGEDGELVEKPTLEQQRDIDRLETNLALYQQIYTNLLQSFEAVRLAEAQGSSTVNLVEQADPPARPFRPNIFQDVSLAVVVGLMVGVGIVFLIEALDDTVKGPSDIARQLGLPVLGFIAHLEDTDNPVTAVHPRAPVSEAFRTLRTNIMYASVDAPIERILVTSPTPQDGKTTIAVNLAVVIAQTGRRVSLLDADLRRPTLHRQLRLANRLGLSDLFVQEEVNLDGALRATRIPNLSLVTSGGLPPNPSELIGSEKMLEIVRQVCQHSDTIIIDTPPVTAVTDAAVLAPKMDGVLLVVRPGVTKLAHTRQTVEQLRRGGANILGVVLNDVERKRSRYNYYYRGYTSYEYYNDEGIRRRKKGKRKKPREPLPDDGGMTAN